jgi:hypothetical protein
LEVILPTIVAKVEQSSDVVRFGINASYICSFENIAEGAIAIPANRIGIDPVLRVR